jgi:hypothetical protein
MPQFFKSANHRSLWLMAAILACLISRGAASWAEMPMAAADVVDSVGLNVHLHSADTPYGNFPLVRQLILGLGVRHLRDGLIDTTWTEYYRRYEELSHLGVKGLFIAAPEDTDKLLIDYPSRIPGGIEGYEAPNEFDRSDKANWSQRLTAFMPRLALTVRSNRSTRELFLVGPSLTSMASYAQVPGIADSFTYANMHNYFGGWNPGTAGWGDNGYGSITWNQAIIAKAWPSKPIFTTETGYTSDLAVPQSIPEDVEGRYIPRVILEQLLHGIKRTYLYELLDEGPAVPEAERTYGLVRADGSKKPAYLTLQFLMQTLADAAPGIPLQDLPFNLQGGSSQVHHLLLQKQEGSYYLAIWVETPAFDQRSRQRLEVIPQHVVFECGCLVRSASLLGTDKNGMPVKDNMAPSPTLSLTISDSVSLLHIMTDAARGH